MNKVRGIQPCLLALKDGGSVTQQSHRPPREPNTSTLEALRCVWKHQIESPVVTWVPWLYLYSAFLPRYFDSGNFVSKRPGIAGCILKWIQGTLAHSKKTNHLDTSWVLLFCGGMVANVWCHVQGFMKPKSRLQNPNSNPTKKIRIHRCFRFAFSNLSVHHQSGLSGLRKWNQTRLEIDSRCPWNDGKKYSK